MRRFRRNAPLQRKMMRLLVMSPLPWTLGMLCVWFNRKPNHMSSLYEAMYRGRIWRCQPGLFTSIDRRPAPVRQDITYSSGEDHQIVRPIGPMITDDMLARFGYNL